MSKNCCIFAGEFVARIGYTMVSTDNSSSLTASRDSVKNSSSLTASRDSVKKGYYSPINHNKQRRKKDHDYTSVSLYLITVTTTDRKPILGELVGNSAAEATINSTDLGRLVIAYFKRISAIAMEKTGCRVQVVQYQLMPDHFHGILYVRDQLPKEYTLGQIISGWKGACTRAEACYKERLRMIRIVNRGLDNRFVYPSGRDLQACSEGFLLVLAPYMEHSDETRSVKISRATCLDMNGYAKDLSTFALSREAGNELNR